MSSGLSLGLGAAALGLTCCAPHLPLSSEDVVSPSGLFLIMPGDYGPPVDNQGELAEMYWRDLEACVGLRHTPRAFPIVLRRWLVREDGNHYFLWNGEEVAGYYDHHALYVLGHPGYSQSWGHEMAHYLFDVAAGDSDGKHRRHEWCACDLMPGGLGCSRTAAGGLESAILP